MLVSVVLVSACAQKKPRPTPAPPSKPITAAPASTPHETSRPQADRYKRAQDGGPAAPEIDVSRLIEPVPKQEPRARYGNKSPYSVLGKTYSVMSDARGFNERGIASWYGSKFHGYMTSSLEPYDMYQFSAAHKSLPLPSYVRVTNLENGKSVVVRVNDRGPFHESRVIDLSYAAAVRIGVWPKGTGLVEVQVLDAAHPEKEPPAPSVVKAKAAHVRIFLQLGAFSDRSNAERMVQQIEPARLGRVAIETSEVNARQVHRVRLGPLASVDAADALVERVEKLGLGTPRVAIDD
jgi:rare lipoprotein A